MYSKYLRVVDFLAGHSLASNRYIHIDYLILIHGDILTIFYLIAGYRL